MTLDKEILQMQRRRGNMLKFVRQGHEAQLDRMDDSMMERMMRNIGSSMSPRQVMTMLQDLQILGYLTFDMRFDRDKERYIAEHIMLTAPGAALVTRRKDTDEILFD